ncbi:MAG: hypothetical protein JWN98_102 [Abditibacteriota bacterium]|nr:hypothetical protein [Abditibacteriota bacterium]
MAIKIDLLPGYVGLRRWFKRVVLACLAVVGLVASVLYLLYYRDQQRLLALQADLTSIRQVESLTKAADTAKAAAEAEAAPIKLVVDFLADTGKTGPERAALLDLTRRYIYERAVISAIDLSDGASVRLTAAVESPDDYSRLLLALRKGAAQDQGPLFANYPTGTGVPGFPEGRPIPPPTNVSYVPQPLPFPLRIQASGALKNPVVVPAEPGTAPAAMAGGMAGGMAGDPAMTPPASQ